MVGEVRDAVVRRRGIVVAGALVAIVLVAVPAFRSSKDWQASATVQLDPFPIEGLHPEAAAPESREAAMQAEIALAESDAFRAGLTAGLDYPVEFDVTGDPAAGTMRFVVRSDTAERSVRAAYAVSGAYLGWGRAQSAVARADELRAELAATAPPTTVPPVGAPPTVPPATVPPVGASGDAAAQLAALETALSRLEGGGGTVVALPEVPGDPVAPNLAAPLVVAGLLGLCAGAAVAWLLERRSSAGPDADTDSDTDTDGTGADTGSDTDTDGPDAATDTVTDTDGTDDDTDGSEGDAGGGGVAERAGSRSDRVTRVALGALAVALVLPVVASALAAVIGVWELRPFTNPRDENLYECLDLWLAPIPDGTTVGVSEDSDVFFRDRFQEVAFPRLRIVDPDHPADVTLRMVPGPGPEACGNYSLERIEP